MHMVDQLVDEHVNNTRQQQTGVVNANDTFQGAGSRMQSVLGRAPDPSPSAPPVRANVTGN